MFRKRTVMRRSTDARRARGRWRRDGDIAPYLVALILFIAATLNYSVVAAEKAFTLSGVPIVLEEVTSDVEVRYQSMRLNRALNVWNVEVTVTPKAGRTLRGPFLLLVDEFVGTSGPLLTDGADDIAPAKQFYDLSNWVPQDRLGPGSASLPRTLSLGFMGGAAPRLTTRVYSTVAGPHAVALARSLNEAGQPLLNVQVLETGPAGETMYQTDATHALAMLGGRSGAYIWKFHAPEYVPVWRAQTLSSDSATDVALVHNPRLTRRSTNSVIVPAAEAGQVTSADRAIRVTFPANSFSQDGTAALTPLTAQTLPAILPQGWSPLQGFWLELNAQPIAPVSASLRLSSSLNAGETAVLVRLDTNSVQWVVTQLVPGNGNNTIATMLSGSGAYAVVVADTGATPPPAAQVGQPLPASGASPPDVRLLTAGGRVDPRTSAASRVAELVTARASIAISNQSAPLPSGLLLRGEFSEDYRLRDGTRRVPPLYESFLVGFQRPGDNDAATLHAEFPVRPQLLLGAEELERATVTVDVLSPTAFNGVTVPPSGAQLVDGDIRIIIGTNSAPRADAVEAAYIRRLNPTNFANFVSGAATIERAFELTVTGGELQRRIAAQFSGVPTNGVFVLAKVVSRHGQAGLEPRERLVSNSRDNLVSAEPGQGEKLPGIAGAGQYLLLRLPAPQALVTGVARNSAGEPTADLPVRIAPWLTFSAAAGEFRLLAPVGSSEVVVSDPATGDIGRTTVVVTDPSQSVEIGPSTAAVGPRVVSINPTNNATRVARVTPIVIHFSEPVNPGTLVMPGAVQILATNGQSIAASVSPNLQNTIVTLLPGSPLPPSALHSVVLSTNITDLTGRRLEGPNTFTFTTETDALDRLQTAQVVSYEPVNGRAAMTGSPGIAEPESPVILVNETTGRTSTILSKPDGSFTNSIEAGVDDFLSAVFVNRNGTRNEVRQSRQMFRDGSVGLFDAGGVVETIGPEGAVQVLIDPGAIAGKSKIKLETVLRSEVLGLASNTPPENANLIGGFKFSIDGDPLKTGGHVSFPVRTEDLNLDPGESPTNRLYALCQPMQADGVTVYAVLDSMQYEDGKIVSHSYPFLGLEGQIGTATFLTILGLPVSFGSKLPIVGRVVVAPEGVLTNFTEKEINEKLSAQGSGVALVPNAFVSVYPSGIASQAFGRGLTPGAFVARANKFGFFRALVPFNPFEGDAILAVARSPRLPNLLGTRVINGYAFAMIKIADVVILRPTGQGSDDVPPIISAQPATAVLPIDELVEVPFLLRDDQGHPTFLSIEFDPEHSFLALTGEAVPNDSFDTPLIGGATDLNQTTVRIPIRFKVRQPALMTLKVRAVDQAQNERETAIALAFGTQVGEPGEIPPSDPNDDIKPQVLSSLPGPGAVLAAGEAFAIRFSEAVRPSITNGNGVFVDGGGRARVELSRDQLVARVYPSGLQPGQTYTLTLNNEVKDIRGNSLDQDRSTAALEPFALTFRTPVLRKVELSEVTSAGGTLVFGTYAYTLDRNNNAPNGLLRVHHLNDEAQPVFTVPLPTFPRAMTLVPRYSFRRRPGAPVETKPLLVIVGGLLGESQIGQWIRVMDISNPEDPQRLAHALVSVDSTIIAANVRSSIPVVAVHLITPEGGLLQLLNLQALILGGNYTDEDWNAAPKPFRYIPGRDFNGDGDFVDDGDVLPIPQKNDVFGLETVLPLASGRELTDFDVAAGGAFLVGAMLPHFTPGQDLNGDGDFVDTNEFAAVTHPSRLQVLLFQGLPVGFGDDEEGALEFEEPAAFRVALDLDFPVTDSTGVRRIPVALVGAGDLLNVVDLTVPVDPVVLTTIRLSTNSGTIFTISRSGADEYAIGAARGVFVLRRGMMYLPSDGGQPHPAVAESIAELSLAGRLFGATPRFFASTTGGKAVAVFRPPQISVVRAPTLPVTNIQSLLAAGSSAISNFLARSIEPGFLLPAVVSPLGNACPSGIEPPDPSVHHYVMIEASGEYGTSVKVAIESLDLGGRLVPAKGLLFPPILLTDHAAALDLEGVQPPVSALRAYRLSGDRTDPNYNIYISDPFVLVREPLSASNYVAVAAIPGRQAIWSGYFARFSLDALQDSPPGLADFQANIAGRVFQPGVSKTYSTLPGEYIDTPNPSLASSPRFAGVNLQSGEYRNNATDLFVEGRHQDLLFSRIYESRSRYIGPLGRGWDFNWNARLLELPLDLPLGLCLAHFGNSALDVVARPGDVLLIDGNGNVMLYRKIQVSAGNTNQLSAYQNDPAIQEFGWGDLLESYYESPSGEFSVLYKFKDGAFVNVLPNGVRTYFQANGRLERVVGIYKASELRCLYRGDGRLDKVRGDRGVEFEIGYYVDRSILEQRNYDRPARQRIEVGLISRIRISEPTGITGEISFEYDEQASLVRHKPLTGLDYLYGYDAANPHLITAIGRGDGAQFPSQTISYEQGLVSQITQQGQTISFGGAKETAAERFSIPSETLTVKLGESPPAEFGVDNRGRPTAFANLPKGADDAGRITTVSDAETTSTLAYDANNSVYRFRGNLLATEQVARPSYKTGITYDGSAYNRIKNQTNTEGATTTTDYFSNGAWVNRIVEIRGPVRRTTHLNQFGQIQREELDEDGHTLIRTVLYDDSGLPNGQRLGNLPETLIVRSQGSLSSLQHGPIRYQVSYNDDGQPETLESGHALAPSLAYQFTAGLVTFDSLLADGRGFTQTYVYDSAHKTRIKTARLTETGLPDSDVSYTYDAEGRPKTIVSDGEATQLTYDGTRLTRLRGPGTSRVVRYAGAQVASVTEQGTTVDFGYDAEGRAETMSQQGATTVFTFNLGDQVASKAITNQSSSALLDETYTYDAAGRLDKVTAPGVERDYDYFADGKIRRQFINGILDREVERDTAGRILKVTLPGLIEYRFSNFDPVSGQPRTEETRLHPTSGEGLTFVPYIKDFTYDDRGRRKTISLPSGTWSLEYDAFGNLIRKTDPDGVIVESTSSPGGLLLETGFSDGTSVVYTYDAARRLQSVGDMSYVLDSQEKLTREIRFPDGSISRFPNRNEFFEPTSADHSGLLQELTWENGRLRRMAGTNDTLTYTYDGLGRIVVQQLNNYTNEFSFDEKGQMDGETTTSSDLLIPQLSWSATFDSRNNLATEEYASGLSLDWEPGTNGQPTKAEAVGITAIEWHGPGLLSAVAYNDGLRLINVYDESLRRFKILYQIGPVTSPTNVAGFNYVLTGGGRVLSEERVHEDRVDVYRRNSNLSGMRVVDFHLSATNATNGAGAAVLVQGFHFDSNGEIASPTNSSGGDARALHPPVTTVNGRITTADGVAVTYNPQGAVARVPVWVRFPGQTALSRELATLTYDGFGLLKQVVRGEGAEAVTVRYTRDGLGRIIEREVFGPVARCRPGRWLYGWKGNQLIEEYEHAGGTYELLRAYVYIGRDLVLVQSAVTPGGTPTDYVPIVNMNGSICGFATPAGELREIILYSPYGTPVFKAVSGTGATEIDHSQIANTLLFQGNWFDQETGLYQLGQRNLHPQLTRFLQRDNKLYVQSRALFAAFNGDPAGFIDPSGTFAEDINKINSAYEKLEEIKGNALDLRDKAKSLKTAFEASQSWEPREESLAGSGLDLTTSGLTFASSFGGENFKEFADNTIAGIENLKLGVDLLETSMDMLRSKLMLTAIRAHAVSPEGYSPTMKWLAAGGAGADHLVLDPTFWADKAIIGNYENDAGSAEARKYFEEFQVEYHQQREENLFNMAQTANSLASALFEYQFKDDTSRGAEIGRNILEASSQLLNVVEQFRDVMDKDNDLAGLAFNLGRGKRMDALVDGFRSRHVLKATFQASFKGTQAAIIAFSDRDTAAAYKQAVEQFNENGGFTTVFSGMLSQINTSFTHDLSYLIQTYSDLDLKQDFQTIVDRFSQGDQRLGYYMRGVNAD